MTTDIGEAGSARFQRLRLAIQMIAVDVDAIHLAVSKVTSTFSE